MRSDNHADLLDKLREDVARQVRALRIERHFTQKELAARLGLSQGRLSEIERGDGSFTAEQFLLLLSLFNVTTSHFAPSKKDDEESNLQNALVRLGAFHLHVVADVPPPERFEHVDDVVREVLLSGSPRPRHLTALAPVLVNNLGIGALSLAKVHAELVRAGRERRLGWIADNTLAAIGHEMKVHSARSVPQLYRRAAVILDRYVEFAAATAKNTVVDLLDETISSPETAQEVWEASSDLSKRWGIATDLQPADFIQALEAGYAPH